MSSPAAICSMIPEGSLCIAGGGLPYEAIRPGLTTITKSALAGFGLAHPVYLLAGTKLPWRKALVRLSFPSTASKADKLRWNPLPSTVQSPCPKRPPADCGGAILARHTLPTPDAAQHLQDAVDGPTVVGPRAPSAFARQRQ